MAVAIESILGRVGDLDSHESIPVPRYPHVFGEVGGRFVTENRQLWDAAAKVTQFRPEDHITVDRPDDAEINQTNVWELKGQCAPGAIDMDRRTSVMDEMGIQRQLIFPMMGIFAWIQALGGGQNWMPKATKEQMALGKQAIDAYNKWAGERTKKSDRMRMVGMILSGDLDMTPDLLVKKAEGLIGHGVKAVMISSGTAPAGLSPGDPQLDPFYATLARNNIALVFHPPSGLGFRSTNVWEAALVNPRYASVMNMHIAERNFLGILVFGGVFERHPTLRVGFVETGADWIGPLCEQMDYNYGHNWPGKNLPIKPSEYVARNVRVSTMSDEPVEVWLQRYPDLRDVYCYSSDYPHVEGGKWSLKNVYDRVAPLGEDVVERFFVTNAQLVLP